MDPYNCSWQQCDRDRQLPEIKYLDICESTKSGFQGDYVKNVKLKGICMGNDSLEYGSEREFAMFLQSMPTLEMLDVSNFFRQDPNYIPRRYALKAISSSIAECRLDVPIFNSMLLSDGINRMRTECLRRGKLCE